MYYSNTFQNLSFFIVKIIKMFGSLLHLIQYSYSKIDPKYIQSTLKKKKREREKLKLDIAGFVYRINISTYQ